jgi:hypothetical protein
VLVDDVVHPALAHALQVTRTSRPPGAVSVKEHVIDQSCVIKKERVKMSVSRKEEPKERERERRERKGLESNFPIATEDDKKIRMSLHT